MLHELVVRSVVTQDCQSVIYELRSRAYSMTSTAQYDLSADLSTIVPPVTDIVQSHHFT
ncbi:MAG TPA: hypothetical protein VF898_06875 [Chloroflexota bacterium]